MNIVGLMSLNRELKRASMDFDWPFQKVWKGYINPFYKNCPACNGDTITKAREVLESAVSSLIYSRVEGISELNLALADKKPEDLSPFGLGGSDKYHIVLKILKLAGLPEKWGWCPLCKGDGMDPAVKEEYENWKQYEPPKGDGYQCWETTSEGSPVSSVFKTYDELCEWLANNPSGVTKNLTKEDWKKALQSDCATTDIGTGELRLPPKEK